MCILEKQLTGALPTALVAILAAGAFAFRGNAAPIKISVQPKGANQVQLTFAPVIPGCAYMILARNPGPEGHWMSFGGGFIGGSNKTFTTTCRLGGEGDLRGLTLETLRSWHFAVGDAGDSDGDGLPDLYEDLVSRTDPYSGDDGYSDPDGDNWVNLQELSSNTDPLRANLPPLPRLSVRFFSTTNSVRSGKAILDIENNGGILPEYYIVERAPCEFHPRATAQSPRRPAPGQRAYGLPTNPPPNARPIPGGPPFGQREDPFVTGSFRVVTRISTQPGVQRYCYVETNVDTFLQPHYRVHAHFVPPPRAFLDRLDATSIRQTLLPVNVRQTTNGFDLVAMGPIPYARYLLLVRDRANPQWRASGYFTAGTNRAPVYLHPDARGMMTSGQGPMVMPEVKFQPDVFEPEFAAGWGEDSDGDGLPDIYEVLVTGTDPLNADTGNTGVLDGYKESTGDGWSQLEKFRRRSDPLKIVSPPQGVVLTRPTAGEALRACMIQSDLRYEAQIEIRATGTLKFQRMQLPLLAVYQGMNPQERHHAHPNFDLRVSWRIPERHPPEPGYHGP